MHRSDTLGSSRDVTCGKQIKHWIEFQLLHEQCESLAKMPYRTLNEVALLDFIPQYTGRTDAEEVIRLDG